jgi:uroporphyrin-III C-methyltransferase
MPGRDTKRLAKELAAAGVASDMPCCAISHAATVRQSHAATTLEDLPGMVCGPAPLLLFVGRAMASLLSELGADETGEVWIAAAVDELSQDQQES